MSPKDELAWTLETKGFPNRVTGYVFSKPEDGTEVEPDSETGEIEDVWEAWIKSGQLL